MRGYAPLSRVGVLRIARRLAPGFLVAGLALFCHAVSVVGAPTTKPVASSLDSQIAQLDALRQQAIAAAHALQERERSLGAIDLAVTMMRQGVETKDQEIAQNRKQEEEILGALERLARAPPEALAFAPEGPVERLRSGVLMAAAVPALAAQARELTGQLAALATVRKQIDASRKHVDDARAELDKGRSALAQLVAQRNALGAKLLHDDGKHDASKPGDASDIFNLIKQVDAAMDQRDKDLLPRLRTLYGAGTKGALPLADPTKPKGLRALDAPQVRMLWPVAGDLTHHAGEPGPDGGPRLGLTFSAMPKGTVVAPFDGRVEYVGRFRDYGLILIIGHGGDYHSLLAGLGHAGVTTGQWLLAGEPVGELGDASDKDAAASLYMELRRGGYPVDPEPRFAGGDQKTEETRVR
jgi:septal ring factor EnvC (AmiA/AmiB activator)